MAKNNFLVLIRKRIEEIHKEYSALRTAYDTLEKVAGLRGRKVAIPELSDFTGIENDSVKAKKGKRGRPRKNPLIADVISGNNVKKSKGKRGRPRKNRLADDASVDTIRKGNGKRGRPRKNPFQTDTSAVNSVNNIKVKRGRKKVKAVKENSIVIQNKASENSKRLTDKMDALKGNSATKPKRVGVAKRSVKKIDSSKSVKSKNTAKETKKVKKGKSQKRSRVPNLAGRIKEIIKTANRFVTNAEITDKLSSTYPDKEKSELSKYMSVVLAQMKGRNEASVIVKDHSGKRMRSGLWGLPNWFDNGKPKNEYLK